MKKIAKILPFMICLTIFSLMIINADTVVAGARAGIELCLYTILPSLFPFVFIASILTDKTAGTRLKFLMPLCKFCNIPYGAEGIFLAGILGGYPVGAQSIYQNYSLGRITESQANHLLRFCNNAGPAFIFGVIGAIFNDIGLCLAIWIIHIISAVIIGALHPMPDSAATIVNGKQQSIVDFLNRTIKTMAKICGWVITFRILIAFINRYLANILPYQIIVFLSGILELSNGCISLTNFDPFAAFLMISFFLSFGGFCVWMQTASIIKPLKMRSFCTGKLTHSIISLSLCLIVSPIWFDVSFQIPLITGIALISSIMFVKKVVAF